MDEKNRLNEEYIEIDLKEYLYILWKNKILILSMIILAVVGSYIVSEYMINEIYSTTSSIKLGVMDNSIYTNNNNVSKIIKNKQFIENLNDKYNIKDEINNYNINISSNRSIVDITLEGRDPEKLKNYANYIAKYYVEISNDDIMEKSQNIREPLNNVVNKIDILNDDINILIKKISDLESLEQKNVNYIQNTLFNIQRTTNDFRFNNIQLFETISKLSKIEKAEIIYLAETPKTPNKPNTKLNVAIALVLGLFLAIFIVFIKQFLKGTDWSEYEDK